MSDDKLFKIKVDSKVIETGNIVDDDMIREDFRKALSIVILSAISASILTAVLFII